MKKLLKAQFSEWKDDLNCEGFCSFNYNYFEKHQK